MPHRLTIEPDFILLELSGTVTRLDLTAAVAEVEVAERAPARTPNRLTDVSGVIARELTFDDFIAIAARRKAAVLKNPVKSAIVASRPVSVGFARMFQRLNDHPQIQIEVFPNKEAAVACLTAP